jgi:triosephosphate isomerase
MKYLYVANWKMNVSFNQSISFCKNNHDALQQISNDVAEIIICSSFVALAPIVDIFKSSNIAVGAQGCSEHALGAYTGEVSALSLAEVGVAYCIVGHSERRLYYNETTETIIKKIYLLYATNIMPIICIGETHEDFANKKTFNVLTEQLSPILTAVAQQQEKRKEIIIAYEPVWAIGTGIAPEQEHLNTVFAWLAKLAQTQLPGHTIQLLYGGSVNQSNIAELKKTPPINGFLIGGASTDFEQFKKIITL